jgi:hypothetical protein
VIVQLLFLHESHCSPTTRIVSRRAVRIRTENNGGHSLGTQQGTPLKTSTCRYISTTTLGDFIESILCLHVCHLNISRGMERYLELLGIGALKISCNLSRILIPLLRKMTKPLVKHAGEQQLRFIRAQIAALYQIFIANTSDARMINRSLQRKLMRASSGGCARAPVPRRHDLSVLSTRETSAE